MKVNRTHVYVSGTDIFISSILICCAWGKISWGWFWVVFIIQVLAADDYIKKFLMKKDAEEL